MDRSDLADASRPSETMRTSGHESSTPQFLDSDALSRTAQLLEEARNLVASAGKDASNRNAEFLRRTADLEASVQEIEQLLIRTERQAAQLANLYVATYQLHASLELADVRAAVADIAVNLLGADAFSVWVRDDDGQLIRAPESSSHLDESGEAQQYVGGDSLFDACLDEATLQFGPCPGSACLAAVPFVAHGDVVGVLLVKQFLSHKQGFTSEDHELLNLLAAHAASALLAARAFGAARRKVQTYEGLLGFLRRETP